MKRLLPIAIGFGIICFLLFSIVTLDLRSQLREGSNGFIWWQVLALYSVFMLAAASWCLLAASLLLGRSKLVWGILLLVLVPAWYPLAVHASLWHFITNDTFLVNQLTLLWATALSSSTSILLLIVSIVLAFWLELSDQKFQDLFKSISSNIDVGHAEASHLPRENEK